MITGDARLQRRGAIGLEIIAEMQNLLGPQLERGADLAIKRAFMLGFSIGAGDEHMRHRQPVGGQQILNEIRRQIHVRHRDDRLSGPDGHFVNRLDSRGTGQHGALQLQFQLHQPMGRPAARAIGRQAQCLVNFRQRHFRRTGFFKQLFPRVRLGLDPRLMKTGNTRAALGQREDIRGVQHLAHQQGVEHIEGNNLGLRDQILKLIAIRERHGGKQSLVAAILEFQKRLGLQMIHKIQLTSSFRTPVAGHGQPCQNRLHHGKPGRGQIAWLSKKQPMTTLYVRP